MNFWTGVHFFSFLVYTFAIFYVIIKNPYALINWVLAILFFYFEIWSFCSFLLDNTNTGLEAARTLIKIQSIGWASFTSYYLLFVVLLTNNKKLTNNPFFLAFTLLSPVLFIYQNYRGEMLQCCRQVEYGQAALWGNSLWPGIYFAYYGLIFITTSWLLLRHIKSTRIKIEKRVAGILLGSVAVVFLLGTFVSVIMNYMKINNPMDVNVIFLIFVGGFIYCSEKYETFTLTSARNADRIMELINEGVLLVDNEGSITSANRAAVEIFGYPDDTEISDAGGFIELKIQSVLKNDMMPDNMENTFIDASGYTKTVLISVRDVQNGRKKSGRICTIRDITIRKKAELDLVETVNELKRSNAELENFAYVASHDLKEPVRMVTNYVQMLKKKFSDKLGKDGEDYINFASDGSMRMSALIDGLLEYSRVKKSNMDYGITDTAATVEKLINSFRYKILDKNASVRIASVLPAVKADAIMIERLFQNILGNALKFTSDNAPAIKISAKKTGGGMCEFKCEDNGIGIDMQYKERIFQIFQRLNARDEYEGTGIGLAICRKIVEAHGGDIWMESEGPGKGSSFIFTLPEA